MFSSCKPLIRSTLVNRTYLRKTPKAGQRRDICTLILLRHGQSQWNGPRPRFTGWCDVPLTVRGRVEAVAAGRQRFDVSVGGVDYRGARFSRYRVWCLQELRDQFNAMPDAARAETQALLERHHCWEPLWRQDELPLLPDQEAGLPFRADTKMVGVNE